MLYTGVGLGSRLLQERLIILSLDFSGNSFSLDSSDHHYLNCISKKNLSGKRWLKSYKSIRSIKFSKFSISLTT